MDPLNVLVAIATLLFLGYLWVKRQYSYWSSRQIPEVEPTFPSGSIRMFGKREHLSLRLANVYAEQKKRGPIIGMYFFVRPALLLTDLNLIRNVLIKDFQYFQDRGVFYNEKVDPLSAHLFNLEPSKWKVLRSKLTPTFTSGKMKFMFPTIVAVAEQFRLVLNDMIKSGEEVEIRDVLGRFTTDVIGTCAFGIECNSLKDPNAKFRVMGKKVFDEPKLSGVQRSFVSMCSGLAKILGVRLHHKDVTEFFLNIVRETIDYREKNQVRRNDFMDLLIQLKNDGYLKGEKGENGEKEVGRLTFNEIAAQAFVFFLAGFETSSTTLTYALYELALAHNESIQNQARDEINTVLAKHDGQLTYEALTEMTYCEQIINESLRKYPPAAQLVRQVTKEYKIPDTDVTLPVNLTIMIPVYGMHHDPDYFEEPSKFKPERFSPENVKNRPACAFLPFGDGPRNCIGLRFGMMQAKIGLVVLLKNFVFSTTPKTDIPLEFSSLKLVLSPKNGVWLKLTPVS